MASVKAYRTAEPRSTDTQQPVLLQGQSPINSLIMGEERWIYNIVNQTNEGLLTPCSPESQVAFMLQILTPPMPPRHSQDKFAYTTTAERCGYNAVSKEEERDGMHSPEDAEASMTSAHLPALSTSPGLSNLLCQLKNENRRPAGVAPTQPIEAHLRVSPNGPSPHRVPPARDQEQP